MSILSYNDFYRKNVFDINELIKSLLSIKPLPLWINPINTKFYQQPGYQVGQIVIAINNKNLIIEYLEPYIKKIADYINLDPDFFKERNNWELDDKFFNTILFGGDLFPGLKIQPITVLSTDVYGFDIYISTKGNSEDGWNYDMPGMSDAWLNLRSTSEETISLVLDAFIEKMEKNNNDLLKDIFNIELQSHLNTHHFRASIDDEYAVEIEIDKYLNELEELYSSRINAFTDILRMPLLQKNNVIGQTILINSSTSEYIATAIIDLNKVDLNNEIIFYFIPNEKLKIVIPTILDFDGDYISLDPIKNSTVEIEPNNHALTVNSFYEIDARSIIYKHTNIGSPLSLNSSFSGFKNDQFVTSFTAIGSTRRVSNIEIQCMPIEEISRTSQNITFKINPKYVWHSNALNLTVSGSRFS